MITFLKKKEGFIGLVLKHIDASAMMDLLLRLISCVEPAPLRQEVLHVSSLNIYIFCVLSKSKPQHLEALKVSNTFHFFSKWLNEEKLVQRLTELIHTGKDEEVSVWPAGS